MSELDKVLKAVLTGFVAVAISASAMAGDLNKGQAAGWSLLGNILTQAATNGGDLRQTDGKEAVFAAVLGAAVKPDKPLEAGAIGAATTAGHKILKASTSPKTPNYTNQGQVRASVPQATQGGYRKTAKGGYEIVGDPRGVWQTVNLEAGRPADPEEVREQRNKVEQIAQAQERLTNAITAQKLEHRKALMRGEVVNYDLSWNVRSAQEDFDRVMLSGYRALAYYQANDINLKILASGMLNAENGHPVRDAVKTITPSM
jgi:hypothetical protein